MRARAASRSTCAATTLKAGIVAGVLFALEFIFIYRGLLYTTASRATLFIYIAPFVVVLGSHFLVPGDRFRWSQWVGLLMSFAALCIAFGVPTPSADPHQILGDVLLLLGGIAWGFTTLMVKSTSLARDRAGKDAAISAGDFGADARRGVAWLFGERITQMPGSVALCVACLSDHLGGRDHLPALVHAGGALFGEPAFGLHIPDTFIRRICRPCGAGRSDHARLSPPRWRW